MLNTGRSVPSQVAVCSACCRSCRFFVDFAAEVVDDAQRGHDDLAGRERGDGRAADPPVPAQRPHDRLDESPGPAQKALPLIGARQGLGRGELFQIALATAAVRIGVEAGSAPVAPRLTRTLPLQVGLCRGCDRADSRARPRPRSRRRRSACRRGGRRPSRAPPCGTAPARATATCSVGSSITNGGVGPRSSVLFSSQATPTAATMPTRYMANIVSPCRLSRPPSQVSLGDEGRNQQRVHRQPGAAAHQRARPGSSSAGRGGSRSPASP